MNSNIIIIGAGGHGKVVAEAILSEGKYHLLGFCDDAAPIDTLVFEQYKVVCNTEQLAHLNFDFYIVAIGNNEIRKKIHERLKLQHRAASIIHPFTSISAHASIGAGTVILPGAVVAQGTHIGENCIIGSNVHIDHETIIGDNSYIRNGSCIGSNTNIAAGSYTNTGESIQSFTQFEQK